MAILGLRAMFFLLSGAASKMHYLPYGLGIILVFIGFENADAGCVPYADLDFFELYCDCPDCDRDLVDSSSARNITKPPCKK